MKKSLGVGLTVLAAVGVATAAEKRPDPCAAGTFNDQACQAAVQNRGYCWNGRWVRMNYPQPYPYYFDVYDAFVSGGGITTPAEVDACGPPLTGWIYGRRGGFGHTSRGHAAHGHSAHG